MKIQTRQNADSVTCILPDGFKIDVVMLSLCGEDYSVEVDRQKAAVILQSYLQRNRSTG